MIVETTHEFVKLKQIKAAGQPEAYNFCTNTLGLPAVLAKQLADNCKTTDRQLADNWRHKKRQQKGIFHKRMARAHLGYLS